MAVEKNKAEVKILQINLNHCRLAHDLLMQTVAEDRPDIVAMSEPLYYPVNWHVNKSGTAAIWVTGINRKRSLDDRVEKGDHLIGVVMGGTKYVSGYVSPNVSMETFSEALDEMEKMRRSHSGPCVVMGDFNAKSPAWGSVRTDRRGAELTDCLGRLGLAPVITEGGPTFISGTQRSVID